MKLQIPQSQIPVASLDLLINVQADLVSIKCMMRDLFAHTSGPGEEFDQAYDHYCKQAHEKIRDRIYADYGAVKPDDIGL